MHRFTTLAKKHEGTTRESHDARNTNVGYPRGYHYKSSLFGFLLSLPERVQQAVTFSPPCSLSERATLRLGLVTGTLLLLTQFVSSFSPPCTGASSGITCGVADAVSSLCRRCTGLFRKLFRVRTVAVHTRPSRPGRTSVTLASGHFPRDALSSETSTISPTCNGGSSLRLDSGFS